MSRANEIEKLGERLLYLSVCAPAEMDQEEVEAGCNLRWHPGTEHGWMKSDRHYDDQTNPCDCAKHDGRRHWLLEC